MNATLLSFNNGEVSPYLRHRIDLEKAASSAETCENFTATPYGAVSKRPGLVHVGMSTAAPANSHLHPFISTDGSRYLLHFTEDLLTIYRPDGTVADTIAFLTSTSPTASDGTSGFWSAPLREIHIEAVNDVIFITHPDIHPLRISRLSDTNWIKEFIPFTHPPVLDQNTNPNNLISVLSNPIAPLWSATKTYLQYDVTYNDGAEWECTAAHNPQFEPGVNPFWKLYWRRKLYAAGDPITISALTDPIFLPGHGSSAESPGSSWKLSPRRDDKDYEISFGALQSNNNMASQAIAMQGAWNITTYGTWGGIFNVQRSDDNGDTWTTIRSYEAKGDRNISDSGTEDTPCLLRLYFIKQTTTGSTGNQRAVLAPEKQFISGYVQANTYVSNTVLTGTALTPVMSGLTSDWSEGAFSTVRGFPSTLSLHESRLCFAGTGSNPVSLWLSQTDDLINFEQGVEDTDSIFVTLAAPYQYPIRWIESQRRLFVGTAVALWVAGSETTDAALTPTNFNARTYAATGSSSTRPLLAGDSLFFTDRKGSRLYQVSFSAESESYEPTDLSRLAEHLTQPGLAQIAWQQTREPCLWAVTRDGKLLQFSYSRRDMLMAWSKHTTSGGTFRNVAILPSDRGDDDVFFIVQRAGGSALERFPQHYQETQETGNTPGLTASPLFPYHYLDGISYLGTAINSLPVPATLIGQALTLITVSAGGVVTTSTVTPTASPLTIASTTRAILGKPITSRLSSLPVDMPGNQSLLKRLHKIALSLFRSKGGTMFNASAANAKPIPYPSTDLYTGWTEMLPDLGNKDEVQVHIVHTDPYPFTVRAVSLRMNQTER